MAPRGIPVPELMGHVGNFLGQVGFPVRDFTMGTIFGTPSAQGASEAIGLALPGTVDFGGKGGLRYTGAAARRYGQRGELRPDAIEGLRVMLHEGLHQMRYGRTPEVISTPQGSDFEEGITEAVTQDLLPILTARLYGHRMPGASIDDQTAYAPLVKQIRQLSVFGSGAKKFQDRQARVWRRQFSHADAAERQRMFDEAMAKRTEWGKRTGR